MYYVYIQTHAFTHTHTHAHTHTLVQEMLIRIDGWLKSLADLPSTFHTSQGLVRVEGGVLKGSLLAQLKGVLHQMQNLGVSFGRKVLTATLEQTRAHTEVCYVCVQLGHKNINTYMHTHSHACM